MPVVQSSLMSDFEKFIIVVISSPGISGNLSSGGLRLLNHDAKAFARRSALTATADNPSATHYDRAGFDRSTPFRVSLKKW